MYGRTAWSRRVVLSLVALGSVSLGYPATPRAQSPMLNGKQRWLAGEALPINAAVEVRARRAANTTGPRLKFAPGRVLVKVDPTVAESSLTAMVTHVGGRAVSRRPFADFVVVHLDTSRDVVDAARQLATEPGVIYAEPDPMRYATYVPNDPLYSYQWNLKKLDMERVWDINRGAQSSLIVAVLDSGVAFLDDGPLRQAPDLAGTTFVSPHDFIWDDDTPSDLDGHGTHVTGTIAQRTGNDLGVAGIAFNAAIMPVKVLSGEWDEILGAPNVGTSAVLAEGLRYAADHGAQVINLSLGGEGTSTAELDAINYAISKGAVIVASAGNDGDIGSPDSYPAAYAKDVQGLIAVAALDFNLARAPYSNSNPYVEIAAPGGDTSVDLDGDGYRDGVLQQTIDPDSAANGVFDDFGFFFFQGTSMAAPHVSGLAALLITQGVSNPKAVEAAIEKFATDIGTAGRDNDTGFGVINPRATIRGLGLSR